MTHPYYAPEFKLSINGEAIPAALRASISRVNFETGLEGADRVELNLVNENLRWLDHPLLALDNQLTLAIGYAPDPLQQMFVGEIVSQSASFPSGGAPTLTVAAQDRMRHLQQGTKERWFAIPVASVGNFPLRDLVAAGLVSLENGLVPAFEPVGATLAVLLGSIDYAAAGDPVEKQKLVRRQEGEDDLGFLKRIASENGWEMFIEHTGALGGYKLRFMSPLDRLEPDLTLKYGRSLIEFTPRISEVGQIVAVSVRLWESETKTEFTVTVSWDWDQQALNISITPGFGLPAGTSTSPEALQAKAQQAENKGKPEQAKALREERQELQQEIEQSKVSEASVTLLGEPVSKGSAPRKIISELIPKLNQRLTGSGSTVGDPRLRAGSVLRLEGLGKQFGGLYRVTSATHTLDSSGYRTSFEVRKEIWFGSIPLPEQGAVPVRLQGQRLG